MSLRIRKRCLWLVITFVCIVNVVPFMHISSVKAADNQNALIAIEDDADLFSIQEEQTIEDTIRDFSESSSWNVFVLTTNDTAGKSSMEYADDYVDEHAFEEDGVCYLIDMQNREIYISTTKGAIKVLTDQKIDHILDDGYAYVSDGDYAGGIIAMVDKTNDYYKDSIVTWFDVIPFAIAGIVIAGVFVIIVLLKYRLKIGKYHYDFHRYGKLDLTQENDTFVNQFVTQHRIETSSGGSSGGSSTHHSSGGGTHGGGGRSF